MFALSSRLFVADLVAGGARELPAAGPVIDPRLSPDGTQVAYVANGGLHVVSTHDGSSRTLAQPDGPDITWGLAEFVASEELERYRGHWWLPDGSGLLVARVDESPVGTWWVADPAHPETEPYAHRYPAAGTSERPRDPAPPGARRHWSRLPRRRRHADLPRQGRRRRGAAAPRGPDGSPPRAPADLLDRRATPWCRCATCATTPGWTSSPALRSGGASSSSPSRCPRTPTGSAWTGSPSHRSGCRFVASAPSRTTASWSRQPQTRSRAAWCSSRADGTH